MWIFFPNAMLSIVAHRGKPGILLVRARFKGDIERIFPGERVERTPRADYLYRAEVARWRVAEKLSAMVDALRYDNVKGAIPAGDYRRSRAMHDTWSVMFNAQHAAEPFQGMDAAEEEPERAKPLPRLFTDAWYSHTTARGEPRTVHVEQVQSRTDGGECDVTLAFQETSTRFTMPMPTAQRWLRNAELLP